MRRPPGTLSPRQAEVARLVGRGLTNRRIATELGISIRTVEAHISNAMFNLDMTSRAEIIELARMAVVFRLPFDEMVREIWAAS